MDNLHQAVHDFKEKYSPYLYFSPEYKLKPITGRDFMRTCTQAKKTTAGLDNWEPAEFALLSLGAFVWMATLLNLVEDGKPWPDGLQHAKAAYLAKDANKTENPLDYRVLMILPCLYMRWATYRLHDLEPWCEGWA